MNLLNLILPTHAKIGHVLAANSKLPIGELEIAEGAARLARFEPWLLGLRNMIEEGDWHSAQVFAGQIQQRLRHLELDERCDQEGVGRR